MKIIKQLLLIFIILQMGVFTSNFIKSIILIPGSIIGMLILFILLMTNVINIDFLEQTSSFFLKHMGFFFIPLGVSLLRSLDILRETWIQLTIVLIISNIIVMFVAGKITEIFINKSNERRCLDD